MGFKDLDLKLSYDSENTDIVNNFYIPVLSNTAIYERMVGYFNSKSLALSARGLKDFILKGSKMKLLCGAQLEPEDVKSIMEGEKNPEEIISSTFLDDIETMEDTIEKNHIQILGYMVAKGLLEIKIVIKTDSSSKGIMHYKIGINKDFDGNYISFAGSNNETGSGWGNNLEQFHVYKSWIPEQNNYLLDNIEIFNKTWEGNAKGYRVIDVPTAVEEKLIEISPKEFEDLNFEVKKTSSKKSRKPTLFSNQLNAITSWFDNDKKGIFSMATGTGKTYTALGCLDKLIEQENSLFTLICVPYQHLITQWVKSIKAFSIDKEVERLIIVDSSNPKGKSEMKKSLLELNNGLLDKVIVITTPNSMSKSNFINIIKETHSNIPYFIIGDEMHELGSYTYRQALLDEYDYRLGLSATPERKYDNYGTDVLFEYFGDIVFSFTLKDALDKTNPLTGMTFLTPYRYHPLFINLNEDELVDYKDLSRRILFEKEKEDTDERKIERLLFERANVIKNAKNKYEILDEVLKSLKPDISNLIVYCSDKQIDNVVDIVGNENNISVKKFTNKDSAKPDKKYGGKSPRDLILEDFANQDYDCLVAMHCLDEGVDVPSASKAILLCNSSNPREFIQRLGRILRRYEDKHIADIYDVIIKPNKSSNPEFKNIENDIYEKELYRCEKIGDLAINAADVVIKLYDF